MYALSTSSPACHQISSRAISSSPASHTHGKTFSPVFGSVKGTPTAFHFALSAFCAGESLLLQCVIAFCIGGSFCYSNSMEVEYRCLKYWSVPAKNLIRFHGPCL